MGVCFLFCLFVLSFLVWFFLWLLPEEVLTSLFFLHWENGDFSILMKDIIYQIQVLDFSWILWVWVLNFKNHLDHSWGSVFVPGFSCSWLSSAQAAKFSFSSLIRSAMWLWGVFFSFAFCVGTNFCVCQFYVHEFHTYAIGHYVSKFLCVSFLNVALHWWNSSYQPSLFLYILQCIVFRCQYVVSRFSLLQQCYIPIVCCKVLLNQLSRMTSTHLFHFFRMSFMPLEP
jgi:hypothetical protein